MNADIEVTARAAALLKELKERHGPLLFHQGGGCCDGSVPFCLKQNEFRIGSKTCCLALSMKIRRSIWDRVSRNR